MDHVEFAKFAIKNKLRSKTSVLAYLKKNNSDEIVKAAENYCFRYGSQLESRLSFAWEWEDAPQQEQADKTSAWDMVVQVDMHFDCAGSHKVHGAQHFFCKFLFRKDPVFVFQNDLSTWSY